MAVPAPPPPPLPRLSFPRPLSLAAAAGAAPCVGSCVPARPCVCARRRRCARGVCASSVARVRFGRVRTLVPPCLRPSLIPRSPPVTWECVSLPPPHWPIHPTASCGRVICQWVHACLLLLARRVVRGGKKNISISISISISTSTSTSTSISIICSARSQR